MVHEGIKHVSAAKYDDVFTIKRAQQNYAHIMAYEVHLWNIKYVAYICVNVVFMKLLSLSL